MLRLKSLAVLAVTLLLSACGPTIVYEYSAPKSADGRVCVAQCSNQRNSCIQYQQTIFAQCQANRNNMQNNYQQCVKAGSKNCTMPPACPSVSTWRCDEGYRACFTACGGHVTPRVVKD